MNRRLAVLFLATAALVLALLPAGPTSARPPAPATSAAVPVSDTNRTLDLLARKLAAAVSSPEIRRTLHQGIAKRFDGDTDVLWSSLAETSDFNTRMTAAATRGRATADQAQAQQVASAAAKLPRLQVAVPKLFDSWDADEFTPLVTFVPEGIDDTELETVTAYDAEGNTVLLDAQVTPDEPVIVIGLNERTDENGKLRKGRKATATTAEATALATTATRYQVGMVIVHLVHDMEPWTKGDAEISHAARTRGCSGVNYEDYNWENLNNDDDWWAPGVRRDLGSTTCPVVFAWWEDDGGAWNFELSYDKFGFGIGMDDDDDMIGKVQLPYSSFQGGSMQKYDGWSNLEMWTD